MYSDKVYSSVAYEALSELIINENIHKIGEYMFEENTDAQSVNACASIYESCSDSIYIIIIIMIY